jgi:hypothetical protein
MYVFGAIYLVTAILVYLYKNEHSKNNLEAMESDEALESQSARKLSILNAYIIIYKLLKLKAVRLYVFILLTQSVIQAKKSNYLNMIVNV